MRPYPWYEINGLTRELEPYAFYSSRRVHFEYCYRPEPDQPLSINGALDVKALRNSVTEDQERYGWISDESIMRDLVHMLWCNPAGLTDFATINAEYMAGFRKRPSIDGERSEIDQARIHMMTACLLVGETYEDDAVSKKLLRDNTLELWGRAWFRARVRGAKRFSPTIEELETTIKSLPPSKSDKFHWRELYIDLGLSDLPALGKQTYKPGLGIFSWMMRSDPVRKSQAYSMRSIVSAIESRARPPVAALSPC
jgi:hypothetical protein